MKRHTAGRRLSLPDETDAAGAGGRLPDQGGIRAGRSLRVGGRAVVRTIVKRGREGYQRCYAEGLARDPRLAGRMSVRFVVDPSGAPASVTDEGTTLPDKQVVSCVLAEASRLRFPSREGGAEETVIHPFGFSPSGAAPDAAVMATPPDGPPPSRPAP